MTPDDWAARAAALTDEHHAAAADAWEAGRSVWTALPLDDDHDAAAGALALLDRLGITWPVPERTATEPPLSRDTTATFGPRSIGEVLLNHAEQDASDDPRTWDMRTEGTVADALGVLVAATEVDATHPHAYALAQRVLDTVHNLAGRYAEAMEALGEQRDHARAAEDRATQARRDAEATESQRQQALDALRAEQRAHLALQAQHARQAETVASLRADLAREQDARLALRESADGLAPDMPWPWPQPEQAEPGSVRLGRVVATRWEVYGDGQEVDPAPLVTADRQGGRWVLTLASGLQADRGFGWERAGRVMLPEGTSTTDARLAAMYAAENGQRYAADAYRLAESYTASLDGLGAKAARREQHPVFQPLVGAAVAREAERGPLLMADAWMRLGVPLTREQAEAALAEVDPDMMQPGGPTC